MATPGLSQLAALFSAPNRRHTPLPQSSGQRACASSSKSSGRAKVIKHHVKTKPARRVHASTVGQTSWSSLDDRGDYRIIRFKCVVTPTSAGPAAASSAPIVTSTACPGTQSASVAACPDRATTACPGDATKKRKRQVLAHVRSGVLAVLRRDGNSSTQTLQDIDVD